MKSARIFRNEGLDLTHNPEFTSMETYEAFADYNDVMEMVERMVSGVAQEVLGTMVVEFDGETIDFTPPWPRLSLLEQIKKHSGIDFLDHPDIESMKTAMADIGIDVSQQLSWPGLMDKLISSRVEDTLRQPCFLIDYPVEMSPLAKKKAVNPSARGALRGLRRGHGNLQRLHRAERPRRPATAIRGTGIAADAVRERRNGQAGRGLSCGNRARDAANRRSGHRHRQAHHAILRPQDHTRGGIIPADALTPNYPFPLDGGRLGWRCYYPIRPIHVNYKGEENNDA